MSTLQASHCLLAILLNRGRCSHWPDEETEAHRHGTGLQGAAQPHVGEPESTRRVSAVGALTVGQGVAQEPAACRVSVRKDKIASHCAEKCVPHFRPTLSDIETGLSALLLAQGHYQLITSDFNFSS